MKKLFIVFIMLIGFTFTVGLTAEPVNAQVSDWSCSSEVVYAQNYALRCTATYSLDIESIVFSIPSSDFHRTENGGIEAYISFESEAGNPASTILHLNFTEHFGTNLTATIDIDFEVYNVDNSVQVTFFIPQSYTSPPAGYGGQIEDAASIQGYYDPPSYRQIYFILEASGSPTTQYLDSGLLPFETGNTILTIVMEDVPQLIINDGTHKSYVEYYDDTMTLLDTRYFEDERSFDTESTFKDLGIGTDNPVYNSTDIYYFRIVAYVTHFEDFSAVDNANRVTTYRFGVDGIWLDFYVGGQLYASSLGIVGLYAFDYPDDPPAQGSYVFSHWVSVTGERSNNFVISDAVVTNGRTSFYAVFTNELGVDVGGIDNVPLVDNPFYVGLTKLGFNDPISRTIFVGVVLLILTVVLFYFKLTMTAIVVIDLLVVLFFSYLGLIPTFVVAMLIVILGYIGFRRLSGGGASE